MSIVHATSTEIRLGLLKKIKEIDPSMPICIRGMQAPKLEGLPEWIAFEVLYQGSAPSRRGVISKEIDVQITVYTRHAEYRSDKKFTAISDLEDKYGAIFHQKDICIKSSCISFQENRIVPLDLRSIGDFAKDIIQQEPPLHTLASVILNTGFINSYKED